VEYVDLRDFVEVICRKVLFTELGYESDSKFKDAFDPLVDCRNSVAHPNRSVITDLDSCEKLWIHIDLLESVIQHNPLTAESVRQHSFSNPAISSAA
jgi:hypothetical protein